MLKKVIITLGENMKIKELFLKQVLDKNANDIGRIDNADFDNETGEIKTLDIALKKNILSSTNITKINYEDIATIGDFIILKIEINYEE
jgi:sporulation protein YlmC with PRC-barrel domain